MSTSSSYDSLIQSSASSDWERAYFYYVARGEKSIDEWIIDFLAAHIQLPESRKFSLFFSHTFFNEAIMSLPMQIYSRHEGRKRILGLQIADSSQIQARFAAEIEPQPQNARFHSTGNPLVDEENYRLWEELLFFQMCRRLLYDSGALDFIVHEIRQHY